MKALKDVTAVLSLKDLDSPFIKDFTMKSYLHLKLLFELQIELPLTDLLNSACSFCSI